MFASGARLPGSCACFALQQLALAFDAPAVARELAVAAHNTMAGDGDREVIGCASLSHRARGFRRTDAFSHLCVTDSGARRNLAQCLPYSLLKGGAAYIKGKAQAQGRCFDEPDDLSNQLLECCVPPISRALGNWSCRSCTSCSGSSPSKMAQIPRWLCATKIAPNEHCPTAKRIWAFGPPAR